MLARRSYELRQSRRTNVRTKCTRVVEARAVF